jgi:hypothetical protein
MKANKTQDEGKQNKNTTQKAKMMSSTNPTKTQVLAKGTHLLYKTPVVLLIYTVKSSKSIGSDREKNIYVKSKRS